MPKKGYISDFMGGGRVVSHGKIADLSEGFSLPKRQSVLCLCQTEVQRLNA